LLPVPRSKFGCPAVPVRAIARPRLAEVLAQPDWRVALVTGGPPPAASATDMRGLPPGFLDQLLTEWSAVTDPLVIVLDDIHHLRSPEITEGLGFVVEHLPGARECS